MWPFDLIKKHVYRKRFNAAIVVFLGTYTYQRLASQDQLRVEAEIDEHFNRTDTPAVASRRLMSAEDLSTFRGAAMDRLGYPLPLDDLTWAQLFKPWRSMRKVPYFGGRGPYDSRPDALLFDYRMFHQATVDAKNLLASKGISVSKLDAAKYLCTRSLFRQQHIHDHAYQLHKAAHQ